MSLSTEGKQYYKICLRHMRKNDNVFMLWGENSSGYTKCIENAGLYEASEIETEIQINRGDFLVHKDIVGKMKQKVRLPMYGDKEETYAGLNEFFVLPNTGQVRCALGITTLNIKNDGSSNSFDAYFKNTMREKLKYEYSKTHFTVKGKPECFTEHWYCNTTVEAKSRDEAISKVLSSGDFGLTIIDCNFIEFKKKVTCAREKYLVLDKWEIIR